MGTETDAGGIGQLDLVEARVLVAKLALEPNHSEIVTRNDVDVPAGLEIQNRGIVDGRCSSVVRDVDTGVFDQHDTAFDTRIEAMVAGKRRCRQRRRSERQ